MTIQTNAAEVIQVGPQLAETWLSLNIEHNRPLNEVRLRRLMEPFRAGGYVFDAQPIRFDVHGRLVDGQHRLEAIRRTGITVPMLVVRGLERKALDIIDTGKSRSAGDAVAMMGVPNAVAVAAAVGWMFRYEHDLMMGNTAPTNAQVRDVITRHPNLALAVKAVHGLHFLAGPGILGFAHYMFHHRDTVLAASFFEALKSGTHLRDTQPVRLLRERLLANKSVKRRMGPREVMALIIKAWNAERDGRPMFQLRWRTVGPKPEEFPRIT